jgi:hypothetical protein
MKVSISDYDALKYKTCICLQIIFISGYYVTDLIPSSVRASKKIISASISSLKIIFISFSFF